MTPPAKPLHLLVLGSILAAAACDRPAEADPGAGDDPAIDPDPAPTGDGEWQAQLAVWQEALEVASGERGAYPFDQAGKADLLTRLEASKAALEVLQRQGLLSASEAGLLQADVDLLTSGVQGKRPTEMELATCYRPVMFQPAVQSLGRLQLRLPLLRSLAAEQVLHAAVVERVLLQVEQDLATLDSGEGFPLEPTQRATADQVAAEVRGQLASIRGRLTSDADAGLLIPEIEQGEPLIPEIGQGDQIGSHESWCGALAVWHEAAAVASGERGPYPFNEEGKKKLLEQLEATRQDLATLQAASLLSAAEAGLLGEDVDSLLAGVRERRPEEMELATCYEPMLYAPQQEALQSLEPRLPLLEQLAAQQVLQPEVVERVLQRVEADLAKLGQPGDYPPGSEEQVHMDEVAERVRGAVERIRAQQAGD